MTEKSFLGFCDHRSSNASRRPPGERPDGAQANSLREFSNLRMRFRWLFGRPHGKKGRSWHKEQRLVDAIAGHRDLGTAQRKEHSPASGHGGHHAVATVPEQGTTTNADATPFADIWRERTAAPHQNAGDIAPSTGVIGGWGETASNAAPSHPSQSQTRASRSPRPQSPDRPPRPRRPGRVFATRSLLRPAERARRMCAQTEYSPSGPTHSAVSAGRGRRSRAIPKGPLAGPQAGNHATTQSLGP